MYVQNCLPMALPFFNKTRTVDLLLEQRDPHTYSEGWHGGSRKDCFQEIENLT